MSDKHTCEAFVATCIDFRFQKYIEDWLRQNIGEKNYDRVAWAGGVFDAEGILKQLAISVRLHQTKKAILINHEDCGAYGVDGTYERHQSDLRNLAAKIISTYPQLQEVESYYLHLDATFEKI